MKSKQIKSIIVEKLFGRYDYELSIPSDANENVFILYGDNGTGKSTILRLMYHLLSTEVGRSHKSYIANIVFKSLTITFDDNIIVRVHRNDDNEDLIGNYWLSYKNEDVYVECEMPCEWDEETHQYRVNFFSPSNPSNRKSYHQIIKELQIFNVFYISDKRNNNSREDADPRLRRFRPVEDPVEKEMALLHDWIISQALEASKKGEEGTSDIYVKILSKLCSRKQKDAQVYTYEGTKNEIIDLIARVHSYSQLGFISESGFKEVYEKLNSVLKTNQSNAAIILRPYIDIQKNRIDALDNLFDTIIYLTKSLNDYLYKKRVIYSVARGFKFYQQRTETKLQQSALIESKDEIDVKRLSSGERQLLILFSMVIRNSNACPIIIIDEPEISLNIKWQRRLLSTLSYFVRDTRTQFMLATHSFEILASHLNNTVRVGDSYIPEEND